MLSTPHVRWPLVLALLGLMMFWLVAGQAAALAVLSHHGKVAMATVDFRAPGSP